MKKALKILSVIGILLILLAVVTGCDDKKDVKDIEKEVEKSIKKGEYYFIIGNDVTNGDSGLKYAYLEKYDAYAVCGLGEHTGVVVNIPEKVNGKPVIAIAKRALAGDMTLQAISVPDSVKVILEGAFEECPFLQQVTIGSKDSDLQYIQNIVFSQTSVSSVTYKGTMSEWTKMLKELPGDYCTTWAYNSNVPKISVVCTDGTLVFWCNSGELIEEIPNPSEGLEYALNSNGKSYSVSGIGTCTDTKIVIPSTYNGKPVTSIGEYAFYWCISLTNIVIPESVTSIGKDAFGGCESLKSVSIPDSVTSIGMGAFWQCKSLKSIVIPSSVTSIAQDTFKACDSLVSVTIPNSVTSIDIEAFFGCDSLTNITIPNSVTSIGKNAFGCCKSLTSVTIPNSVTSIAQHTFDHCTSLKSITIPKSVKSIGKYAFNGCTALKNINFGGTKTQWNAIEKENNWDIDTNSYKVNCTDGTIKK